MNRRTFLNHSGQFFLAGSSLSLFKHNLLLAQQDNTLPHLFMVIKLSGSMDTLCGLNPWIEKRPKEGSGLFLDDEYKVLRNINGTNINLGPSAHSLKAHSSELAIINGIMMGATDLGHPYASNYITKAKGAEKAPHFISELAEAERITKKHSTETILFNTELETFNLSKLSTLPVQDLNSSQSNANLDFTKIPILSSDQSAFNRGFESLINNSDKRNWVRSIINKIQTENDEIKEEQLACAAFAANMSQFAQINWNYMGDLDNHVNFPDTHKKAQQEVWERLSALISLLKTTTYMDTEIPLFPNLTTLLFVPEFSRTPGLNDNKGKDHNYYDNSCILAGRGVKGGQSIGGHSFFAIGDPYLDNQKRTQAQLSSMHINYSTGQSIQNDRFNTNDMGRTINEDADIGLIRPENIWRTVCEILNTDMNLIQLVNEDAKILPII